MMELMDKAEMKEVKLLNLRLSVSNFPPITIN